MATLVHVQTLCTRLLFKAQGTRLILMRQFSALQILTSAWIKSKEHDAFETVATINTRTVIASTVFGLFV